MKVRWLTISTALAVAAVASASRGPRAARAQPVITRLVGRNSTITVTATGAGPRYSVTNLAGKTLIANATLDELREKDRQSYQQINGAITYAGIDTNE